MVRRVALERVVSGWYGVWNFVVLSVVELCVDYGGVNVFHVCLDFGVVYGVGACVNVYGVVVCCLCLTSGCCDFCLICDACTWGCSFIDSVSLCVLCTQLLF